MSSFTYLAILGRQPELGMVELEAVLGPRNVEPFGKQAAFLSSQPDINRLGGSVKLAEVLYRGKSFDLRKLPIEIGKLPRREAKVPFGISVYGLRETPKTIVAVGLELKKQLKALGPVRLVMASKGTSLSAAQLRHNRILEDGFELVVTSDKDEMVLAITTAVQDVDWYSQRDYGRPCRNADVGMLPPKLAQVLVNTVGSGPIEDPFCGTGVVLQEALLMGHEAYGSDLSGEMVESARANLEWLGGQVDTPLPRWNVKQADAREVVMTGNVSIVSEGYLGPNLNDIPDKARLLKIKQELRDLYRKSFKQWARTSLVSGSELSICVPVWRQGFSWSELGIVDDLSDLGYNLRVFEHVAGPIIYGRNDQVVGRQLLFIRKT